MPSKSTAKKVIGKLKEDNRNVQYYRLVRAKFLNAIGMTYELTETDMLKALHPAGARMTYVIACDYVGDFIADHGGLSPAELSMWTSLTATERAAMTRVALREYFSRGEIGLEGL